ncbi:MAG: TonB C-terminal domain-containing protein [bacterium]
MNKTNQRTKSTHQLNYLEIIILMISILTHLFFLSSLNFLREYPTRLVSTVQIRLAKNSVSPSNQVHLPSIIQFPENPLKSQQIVDVEDFSELEFDVVEMPTEIVVPPEDEVNLDLEKLIQESESELSLIPMPSASLPKGNLNRQPDSSALNPTLAAVADQEGQNFNRQDAHSFSKMKLNDEEFSELIPEQEQGTQFEDQRYGNRINPRKEAKPNLPEGYFLSESIIDRETSESNRQSGEVTNWFEEAPASSISNGQQGLLGLGGDGFFTLSNYQWPYESYMGRWAKHLRYAWNSQPPEDYIQGSQPNGGNVVIQVQLSRLGELESFEIISSFGSSIQMEESVVNAILSVSQLPPLPDTFQDENLIVSFRFIYPPY